MIDVEHDGQLYKKHRDPPGQKSIYILPGDDYDERYRLSTFEHFPYQKQNLNLTYFAKCGFSYTGFKDRLKCYSCGMYVENWNEADDPAHSDFHYTNCLHLKGKDTRNLKRSHIEKSLKFLKMKNFFNGSKVDFSDYKVYIPPGNLCCEKYRLATFAKFPAKTIEASILAMNGFYYTGDKSKIRCFSCGVTKHGIAPYQSGNRIFHKPRCEHARGLHKANIPLNNLMSFRNQYIDYKNEQVDEEEMEVDDETENHNNASLQTAVFTNPPTNDPPRHRCNHVAVSIQEPIVVSGVRLAKVVNKDHLRFLKTLDLCKEEDRRKTFRNAGHPLTQVGFNNLAANGFFYLGDKDRTQCFSCQGVLRSWGGADSPYFEHRSNFSECAMVRGNNTRNKPGWSRGITSGKTPPVQPNQETGSILSDMYKCREPHNPEMGTYERRLRSFIGRWPLSKTKATPEQIARAGFYSLGTSDKAKCYYCNGGLQNWDFEDEPWTEHAKWFPGCEHVLKNYGPSFVVSLVRQNPGSHRPSIQKAHSMNKMLRDQQKISSKLNERRNLERQPSAGELLMSTSPSNLPSSTNQTSESTNHEAGSSSEVPIKKHKPNISQMIEQVKELGFSEYKISSAHALLKKENFTFGELLDALFENNEEEKAEFSQIEVKPEEDNNKINENSNKPEATDETKLKILKLEQEKLCKKCKKIQADHLALPCGHLDFCGNCAGENPDKCPLCDKKINQIIKTFSA